MRLFISLSFLLFVLTISAQGLTIDNSYTPSELVMDFFDSDSIVISNVVYTGSPLAIGFFDSEVENLAVHAGIVLGTGKVSSLPMEASAFLSNSNGTEGDVDIETFSSQVTYDAAVLEFDFTVTEDLSLDFSYVFGSEEYPEYVDALFNDGFGFFISGPNFSGIYANNAENIALIPDTEEVVSINTVNENSNSDYYVDNSTSTEIGLDAFTTLLPAKFTALANQTYHIKIVVADVADNIYDSAVFLGFNSLGNPDSLVPPAEVSLLKNGTDLIIENNSKYATSYYWDFGNGETSVEKDPGTINYQSNGDYSISLITSNYCCSDTFSTTVEIGTFQEITGNIEISNAITCFGASDGTIVPIFTGGDGPYNVTFTPDINDITQVGAGNYQYFVSDVGGNSGSGQFTIGQPTQLIVNLQSTDDDGTGTGTASVIPEGGTFPYEYLWSNNETTEEITDLEGGVYTVTVTDKNGCELFETVTVAIVVGLQEQEIATLKISPNPSDYNIAVKLLSDDFDEVRIHDVFGKEFNIELNRSLYQIEAKITHLPSGVYFLVLTNSKTGEKSIGKFIKTN